MITQYFIHRRTQRALYDLAVGEEPDERVRTHASTCPVCRGDLAAMREALGLLDTVGARSVLDRPDAYWQNFAARVAGRIAASTAAAGDRPAFSWFGSRPAFVAGAATAMSVVAIVAVAWWWSVSPEGGSAALTTVPGITTHDRVYEYLARSRVVLVGVLNADVQELRQSPGLLRQNGAASRLLVEEARELNRELTGPGDVRLRQLVNELEVILVQLANLEAEEGLPGLEIIRDGVDRRGVLLKITIEEMGRTSRADEDEPRGNAAEPDRRSL